MLTRGVDSIHALESQIAAVLNESLNAASPRCDARRGRPSAWAAIGLLVVCVIGVVIIRDITVTLRQVVEVANGIAIGDLTGLLSVEVAQGRDWGAGTGVRARMVAALKETVGMAERIAAGDLTVKVQPRSEQRRPGACAQPYGGEIVRSGRKREAIGHPGQFVGQPDRRDS